jgi:ABC-2 type transport system ATP-binding protein
VDHLSLNVRENEIYAFLGLNGAGKTTTIRMLLGMIQPNGGEVQILGQPVQAGTCLAWKDVGHLVETPHAYAELTVRENLEVVRRLHPGAPASAISEVVELLSLGQYADRPAGSLSLGNAQRLGLAKALLHHPQLVILDEPANGLDPAGIVEIRELLIDLTRNQGVTVFMSSHILAEVNRLADRIGIIHQGRLIQELNREELEMNRRGMLQIGAADINAAKLVLNAAGYPAELTPDARLSVQNEQAVRQPDMINTLLMEAGITPNHLAVVEEDLEDYFLRLVQAEGGKND